MVDDDEFVPLLHIEEGTNYWIVRAEGGKYLTDFERRGFVSIGHDAVTVQMVTGGKSPADLEQFPQIRPIFVREYPDESKQTTTLRANQLEKFIFSMQIGDIVVVPGENSDFYAIGVIVSDAFDYQGDIQQELDEEGPHLNYQLSRHKKRRNVLWIKEVPRRSLPKGVLMALTAQQAIMNIPDGHGEINELISPVLVDTAGVRAIFETDATTGLNVQQLQGLAQILETASPDQNDLVHVDFERNSPLVIKFLTDPSNQKLLLQLLQTVIGSITALGGTGFAFWVLKLLLGKRFKEIGLIPYVQEIYRNHWANKLQNKKNRIAYDKLVAKQLHPAKANKHFSKLHPRLRNVGNEIQDQSQTGSPSNSTGRKQKGPRGGEPGQEKDQDDKGDQ